MGNRVPSLEENQPKHCSLFLRSLDQQASHMPDQKLKCRNVVHQGQSDLISFQKGMAGCLNYPKAEEFVVMVL